MNDVWNYRDEVWSESDDVVGYDVEATDGKVGKIDEATSETDAAYVVVDTGLLIFGKRRLIPAGSVISIDHDAGTVAVSLSKDQIKAGPDYDETTWDEESRTMHSDYYGPFAR
jgi:hypothetical protein